MTEVDLKKMNRKQLLELLLKQTERADKLQEQLQRTEEKLQNRKLIETEAGSIAEAALKLYGIFEAADGAATLYVENIKKISEQIEADARKKADEMIAETERRCAEREAESEEKLRVVSARIQKLCKQENVLVDIVNEYKVK